MRSAVVLGSLRAAAVCLARFARYSSNIRKYPHLRRRSSSFVFRPNRQKPHCVAESPGDLARPVLKLLSRPLEAMTGIAEAPGRQRLPLRVVVPVRRREHDRWRFGELEQHPLECGKPWRVQVLDDLDGGSGIETLQPRVAVHERAVDKPHPFRLFFRQSLQLQPPLGHFERADRDIQSDDLLKLFLLQKLPNQLALATAAIEDALGTAGPESRHD